jgi:hypothetical protein
MDATPMRAYNVRLASKLWRTPSRARTLLEVHESVMAFQMILSLS